MKSPNLLRVAIFAGFSLLGVSHANAYLTNPATCSTDSATMTLIETSPLDGNGVVYSAPPVINATSCFGVVSGNDAGTLLPEENIGQLNDGLLNGEGGLISPTQFISPSQLLDLDKDGTATDPGWIYLGSVEQSGNNTEYLMNGFDKPLNIDEILSLSMTCTATGDDACTMGTWKLVTQLDIIEKVQAVLGRNSFDHLAFVIKAGNQYGIYDFDFNILLQAMIDAGLSGFDYTTPYSFTGTWNTDDFLNLNCDRDTCNAQNMSHISVWVRDPLPANDIPLPGTVALAGLGLVLMAGRLRRAN